MDIFFCDICNESVPVGHLSDGRAFRRKGRVVCATCDAAMGGGGSLAEELAAPTSAPWSPNPSPAGQSAAQSDKPVHHARRRGGSLVAGFALFVAVFAVAAGSMGIYRVEQRSVERDGFLITGHEQLNLYAKRVNERLDGMVASVGGRLDGLNVDLTDKFDLVSRDLAAKIHELSESIERSTNQITALETTMLALDADLHATDEEMQTRLDALAMTNLDDRAQVDALLNRLSALEDLVHSGALAAAPTEDELDHGPAWQVALDDLASGDSAVRWNAVQALAESGDPAVVPHLVPLLGDEDIWVRMAAAGALGDLGAVEAIEPLIGTLEDPETAVRERAMLSLRAITGRSFQFDPGGSESSRAKIVKKWRDWWAKARTNLVE